MEIVIQVILLFLAGFVMWCEQTPFFAHTFKSVALRLFVSTGLIGLCYHANVVSSLPYYIQFLLMASIMLITIFTIVIALKRYEYNKAKLQLRMQKGVK